MTLKLDVVHDHIRFQQVRCGSEPGDSILPSTTKVTDVSGIGISEHFKVGDAELS